MMINFKSISYINEKKSDYLKQKFIENNYCIYEINGNRIVNIASFINEVINILPQDPPLNGNPNLDAFADSLWGGIDKEGIEKVVILWKGVNKIIDNCLMDFHQIIECLEDLLQNLSNIEYMSDKPTNLLIVLLGNGSEFQYLEM
ncbi:barstar family protein [Clostridium saccharobutylicum]|uniref:Barstar (barnase inhibitor) domain-containing protein n=1 Tax=Clostridium saccharobutylicum TaxID=169679 RepID=A0A1S8NHQ6_CLOSA|nr:barstar family protein [Clostridium saccharobutylicum]OOM15882.1 hypothetical protein CLOSAC_01530 [Clostridium saccharobutylicum]